MKKVFLIIALLKACVLFAQQDKHDAFTVRVVNEKQLPAMFATVELLHVPDSAVIKKIIADTLGTVQLPQKITGQYLLRVSITGYLPYYSAAFSLPLAKALPVIALMPAGTNLKEVKVTAGKQGIQFAKGKVIINPDASVTNTGTSVLEVLEKSPGVTVDRNGGISLQGKSNVLVLIDGQPTYVSGSALESLLSGMSSSVVDQVELIANPPAKYDASGNAGVINIKTKKNKQEGFNGSVSIAAGAGRYPKSSNSFVFNYRKGKINAFVTYNLNYNKSYTELYALRTYYNTDNSIASLLDQPTYFTSRGINNTLKTGVDYFISPKTTLGIAVTGVAVNRKGTGDATATWLNAQHNKDSAISTISSSNNTLNNGAVNINLRHTINEAQEFSVDLDAVTYKLNNTSYFANHLLTPSGYSDASDGRLPSKLHIFSAKGDHTFTWGKTGKVETGLKASRITTDNIAAYQYFDGTAWMDDLSRSNHFKYDENIYAAYSSIEKKIDRFSLQAGLRYEFTHYNANQLGNAQVKDSSFSHNYGGLFPSGYIAYEADSASTFTFTAGRRIDRPAFQALNPFVYVINKYTYERGNPYFLPQYSWNLELSHQYKQVLTTTLAYSIIKNYFSQLFLTDPNGILVYTQGNVGRMTNLGLSVTAQVPVNKWWSFTGEALLNHKELKGYVWNSFASSVTQLNISINNQFHFGKVTGELSGYYTTRARNDLQEILYPTGQLSAGAGIPILAKKGTLKLTVRDIFHTRIMEGLTSFQTAQEYFIEHFDSRVITISFNWRFGKQLKQVKHSSGGAGEEMERAGGG